MCRVSLDLKNYEIKNAKTLISEYLDDSNFGTYVNDLDLKNIMRYIYDRESSYNDIIFAVLMSMIIEDTGEQFFIDNAKLSNIDGLLCDLIFEDDVIFRGDQITELDYRGVRFEGKVTFDCDFFTSAFSFCAFFGDIVFTNNCKLRGSFKQVLTKGNIIITGGMFSIDISNFHSLFTERTVYTGTKDEFLALVARSGIPKNMIDQAKNVVKFTKIDWEK